MDLALIACAILVLGHAAFLVLLFIEDWAATRVSDVLFAGGLLAEAAGFVCAIGALLGWALG